VEQSKGATIRGFNEETENGQTTYEVEMVVNGHIKDVQMDANGVVIEVEEEVSMEALPAEIKAGLQAKAGKGKITKVESLTKKGKLVAYEAQVMTDGKKVRSSSRTRRETIASRRVVLYGWAGGRPSIR
jgi:uncharacterized membrane protein YkoI